MATGLDAEPRAASSRTARCSVTPPLRDPGARAHPERARDVADAIGVSTGLARLLQKPKVHDEFAGDSDRRRPECGTDRAAAQIASDANVQLAGLAFEAGLSAVDGEIVNVFHTASADTEDQTIVAPLETLQRLYATDAVTFVAAWLHDASTPRPSPPTCGPRCARAASPRRSTPIEDYDVNPYYVGSMSSSPRWSASSACSSSRWSCSASSMRRP